MPLQAKMPASSASTHLAWPKDDAAMSGMTARSPFTPPRDLMAVVESFLGWPGTASSQLAWYGRLMPDVRRQLSDEVRCLLHEVFDDAADKVHAQFRAEFAGAPSDEVSVYLRDTAWTLGLTVQEAATCMQQQDFEHCEATFLVQTATFFERGPVVDALIAQGFEVVECCGSRAAFAYVPHQWSKFQLAAQQAAHLHSATLVRVLLTYSSSCLSFREDFVIDDEGVCRPA